MYDLADHELPPTRSLRVHPTRGFCLCCDHRPDISSVLIYDLLCFYETATSLNMEFEVTYFCVPRSWTLTFSTRINSFLASLEQEPFDVVYITLSNTSPARDIQPHLIRSDGQLLHTVTLLTEATFWEGWPSGKDKHWLYHLWLHSNFKKEKTLKTHTCSMDTKSRPWLCYTPANWEDVHKEQRGLGQKVLACATGSEKMHSSMHREHRSPRGYCHLSMTSSHSSDFK